MESAPDSHDGVPNHNIPSDKESQSNPAERSTDLRALGPSETAKRTTRTRVHKREQELSALGVTPSFLPLLEAREVPPTKKRKEKKKPKEGKTDAGTPSTSSEPGRSRDADKGRENRRSRSKSRDGKMEYAENPGAGDNSQEAQKSELAKKAKRAPVKRSSLRLNNAPGTTKSRRKRVSLVIDDQIVLPADNIVDRPQTTPSEITPDTSNPLTPVDDAIDPRLFNTDPVHHSLPYPIHEPLGTSPLKHRGHTLADSPHSIDYGSPQTATRTVLDPSQADANHTLPPQSSASPIYANALELALEEEEQKVESDAFGPDDFHTYVGGMSGSGADNLDQVGSYGYPSSLGASYLESYMKSRPLRVRMAAAEKAELEESEKRKLLEDEGEGDEGNSHIDVGTTDDLDEDMDVIGNMEDF